MLSISHTVGGAMRYCINAVMCWLPYPVPSNRHTLLDYAFYLLNQLRFDMRLYLSTTQETNLS